ncbi:sirohydrochlorin chelatase [Rothia aerolata]|uniref:Cobalamin biosynthesis protein CbiX n=1 Tax=Rothia aerolata TaxID=1812262 RepID=A0A917INW2_9MICC|nr:CbiX/SirB N-terminal domain-containing protein [Rothia aerolata]GGH58251.1 hypothetical protein GCM10007359_04230 [Rothia aerolata]
MIHLVATSHGTNNLQGRESIALIREQLAALLHEQAPGEYTVHEAFVDVQEPSLETVLAGLPSDETVVLVPLLLSTGYHTQVDMQRAAEKSGIRDIRRAEALGPSPLLAELLADRLKEAGWAPGQSVVLAGAGSSRADGRSAVEEQTALLSQVLGQQVSFGFVAEIDPKLADELTANCFIANYLMSRGFFDTKVKRAAEAAGAFGTAPLVVPGDDAAARVLARVALARLEHALAD